MASSKMITNKTPTASGWTLEGGYVDGFKGRTYPNRVIGSDRKHSLDLVLSLNEQDEPFVCHLFLSGFTVHLNPPGEQISEFQLGSDVETSVDVKITIKPKLKSISKGLSAYKPNQRQCLFNSEKRLRFYNIYTKINCEEECLANFTRNECECVKFSMSRDKDTKICGAASINCYKMARKKYESYDGKLFRDECNCMDLCINIQYDYEIKKNNLLMMSENNTGGFQKSHTGKYITSIGIGFKETEFINTVKRNELYTFADFLAICGGLLGLFMGFSALSFIELIYFATLHLFWKLRYLKAKNAVAPTQLVRNVRRHQEVNAWM
ncbi:pickpocket protein 28-like [Contarinia nasturtii]|uniref:pickpocket protein 28-like n=1 Tax=Contarinia nasturtii TaxID=265458 RepID=UPI0012D4C41C|nr:pickpocket protein 28-like [Contarinia nasturtii]